MSDAILPRCIDNLRNRFNRNAKSSTWRIFQRDRYVTTVVQRRPFRDLGHYLLVRCATESFAWRCQSGLVRSADRSLAKRAKARAPTREGV